MAVPQKLQQSSLAPNLAAPQHKPRPLTLFLELLRSETAANPARMSQSLLGLRRYQEAARPPPIEPMPALSERLGAALRDYGPGSGSGAGSRPGSGAGPEGAPVLFVPSLINPPNILDLSQGRSLLRWLAERGHRPLLLDWGWDVAARQTLSVAGHVEQILLPMIRELGEPPALVGYCLGGTMAVAAAALAPVRSIATIAAPWHFAGFPDEARERLHRLWQSSAPAAAALGALPMEALQSAFWSLDPARTVAKFEAFAALDPESPEAASFVALEDWANDGPPIPQAAARELFEDFLEQDSPGAGAWQVGGRPIDATALPCPLLNIVSTSDRIVPHSTSIRAGERIELGQGHVGMVVGGRAREMLWEPLEHWLSRHPARC
jgi:polyhydroxyalkanoate synthase subunit PhaC